MLRDLIKSAGGVSGVPDAEINVLPEAAQALSNPRSRDDRELFFTAVEEQQAVTASPERVSALLIRTAGQALNAGHHRQTDRAGQLITIALRGEAEQKYRPYVVRAYSFRAAARLSDNMRRGTARVRLRDAYVMLSHVRNLYQPQSSIVSFDPDLANIEAYRIAISSLMDLLDVDLPEDDYVFEGIPFPEKLTPLLAQEEQCPLGEIDWMSRKAPKMTDKMINSSWGGAVLLGFSLSEDGRPVDVRILAEVPAKRFSDISLEVVEKEWRADVSNMPAECRQDITTAIQFIFGY